MTIRIRQNRSIAWPWISLFRLILTKQWPQTVSSWRRVYLFGAITSNGIRKHLMKESDKVDVCLGQSQCSSVRVHNQILFVYNLVFPIRLSRITTTIISQDLYVHFRHGIFFFFFFFYFLLLFVKNDTILTEIINKWLRSVMWERQSKLSIVIRGKMDAKYANCCEH